MWCNGYESLLFDGWNFTIRRQVFNDCYNLFLYSYSSLKCSSINKLLMSGEISQDKTDIQDRLHISKLV